MAEQAKDQTPEGNPEEKPEEIPKETAEVKETPPEEKTDEQKVDYEIKFKESQKEALRLRNMVLEYQKSEKAKPAGEKTEIPDVAKLVDQKVRERIAPLEAQAVKDTVDSFLKENPGASEHLDKINELLPDSPGKTISEKLENAYLIASKDVARQAGKQEMAFNLYQKGQAVVSGGSPLGSKPEGTLPTLSAEEKKVARSMGLTDEDYAKNKWREPRPDKRRGQ